MVDCILLLCRQKRPTIAPVSFDSNGAAAKRVAKNDQRIYSPPSGKFSEKAGTYQGSFCSYALYVMFTPNACQKLSVKYAEYYSLIHL